MNEIFSHFHITDSRWLSNTKYIELVSESTHKWISLCSWVRAESAFLVWKNSMNKQMNSAFHIDSIERLINCIIVHQTFFLSGENHNILHFWSEDSLPALCVSFRLFYFSLNNTLSSYSKNEEVKEISTTISFFLTILRCWCCFCVSVVSDNAKSDEGRRKKK